MQERARVHFLGRWVVKRRGSWLLNEAWETGVGVDSNRSSVAPWEGICDCAEDGG